MDDIIIILGVLKMIGFPSGIFMTRLFNNSNLTVYPDLGTA